MSPMLLIFATILLVVINVGSAVLFACCITEASERIDNLESSRRINKQGFAGLFFLFLVIVSGIALRFIG